MEYDFDTLVDRNGTHSLKWDVADGELPMWVADMDFCTAPEVLEAIKKRAEHGVFGYTQVDDEWYGAYHGWWEKRHGFAMEKDWLIFCTGVVPAVSSMVRKLTSPAEKVVILTPVYNIFFNSVLNNGRQVLESRLVYDGEKYEIDWADLEAKLFDPQTSLMIFCNPHNPIGKIWDRQTLERIGTLCTKYHVTVISDEIHCDLTDPGYEYIPFASVSDECRACSVTCIAPTKTFNLAGLQTAAVAVPDPYLRHRVWRGLNTDEVAEPGAFAVDAAVAAFTKGEAWLDALREYLFQNKKFVREYIKERIGCLKVLDSTATYLLWIDCGAVLTPGSKALDCSGRFTANELAEDIRRETGLYLSAGNEFGGDGDRFLRMNTACPRARLEDGLNRLDRYFQKTSA